MDDEKQLSRARQDAAESGAPAPESDVAPSLRERAGELFTTVDLRVPVVFWLTSALLVILLPAWLPGEVQVAAEPFGGPTVVSVMAQAMLNPLTLITAGLLISVYSGVLNLGVWAVALVSAWLMARWHGSGMMVVIMGGACLCGLACRWVSIRSRLGATLLTLAMGAGGYYACGAATAAAASGPDAPAGFITSVQASGVLSALALIFVASVLAVSASLAWLTKFSRKQIASDDDTAERAAESSRTVLLVASFVAAALGGCIAGMTDFSLVATGGVLGDLRVFAAASVALVAFRRGRGGAVLSCLLAPLGLLVANMWLQCVGFPLGRLQGTLTLTALTVMLLGARAVAMGRGKRMLRRMAACLCAIGVVAVALSAYWPVERLSGHYLALGGALWLMGLLLGLLRVAMILAPDRAR